MYHNLPELNEFNTQLIPQVAEKIVKIIDDDPLNQNNNYNNYGDEEALMGMRCVTSPPADIDPSKLFKIQELDSQEQIKMPEVTEARPRESLIYELPPPPVGPHNDLCRALSQSLDGEFLRLVDIETIVDNLDLPNDRRDWGKDHAKLLGKEIKKCIQNGGSDAVSRTLLPLRPRPSQRDPAGIFEPTTEREVKRVIIDSQDRDTARYPNPNPFRISFGASPRSEDERGFVNESFDEVESIKLVEAIVPAKTLGGDDLSKYPYLLLNIHELGSSYVGTNANVASAFAKLNLQPYSTHYLRFEGEHCTSAHKIFRPRVQLSHMTFELRTPNGDVVNVKTHVDASRQISSQITFIFEITMPKRRLASDYF
jgi:hypothetical protein